MIFNYHQLKTTDIPSQHHIDISTVEVGSFTAAFLSFAYYFYANECFQSKRNIITVNRYVIIEITEMVAGNSIDRTQSIKERDTNENSIFTP